jgi:hypothetical protein
VPFNVAVAKKIRHFMETVSPFPGGQHGLEKV